MRRVGIHEREVVGAPGEAVWWVQLGAPEGGRVQYPNTKYRHRHGRYNRL
jgi:hypothetical protein